MSAILLCSAAVLVVILSSHRASAGSAAALELLEYAMWLFAGPLAYLNVALVATGDRPQLRLFLPHLVPGSVGLVYLALAFTPPESALGRAVGHTVHKATGGRGHKLALVPDLDLVVVQRLATGGVGLASQLRRRFLGALAVDDGEFNELMRRIVAAHPARSEQTG